MKGKNFRIVSFPKIIEAECECGSYMNTVPNGILMEVQFCSVCENVYELRLVKIPKGKIKKSFLKQCRKKVNK
jgi:hypothetical protein